MSVPQVHRCLSTYDVKNYHLKMNAYSIHFQMIVPLAVVQGEHQARLPQAGKGKMKQTDLLRIALLLFVSQLCYFR